MNNIENLNNVENLKELRKKAGLTQMQLAAKLGVSLMSIRIWESGAGKPNNENFKKLVKLFNLFKPFEVIPLRVSKADYEKLKAGTRTNLTEGY